MPAVVVALTFVGWAAPARAQAQDPGQRVTELNKKAVEAYENLEIEEAGKFLRQALEVCAAEGLNNRAKARTHIHLGMVLVGGFKQRDRGIQQFKRALEIDPAIGLTKQIVNPEIQAAFDEAKKEMALAAPAPPPPREAAKPPETAPAPEPPPAPAAEAPLAAARAPRGIVHTPLTEARPSSTISVKAAIDPSLAQEKIILAYRPEGASDFLARDMEKDGQGWYVARIPEPATRGAVVSYYIEARNRGGQALAASGSATEPYVISLSGETARASGGEGPAAMVRQTRRSDVEETVGAAGGDHRFWLSVGLGSGFGWARGTPEVNPTDKRGHKIELGGAFAPARLMHIVPEVGYFLAPNLLLSLQGRVQVVTSATEVHDPSCPENFDPAAKLGVCPPAKWALAVLGKATWLLGEPRRLRPFVSVAAGGGEIRHLVKVNLNDCGADRHTPCQDTLLGGVILLGPGAGVSYDLGKALSAVVSLNSLVGIPNPTVNFDLNLGVALGL
jgi:hypothetical protein